jgi:predicted permease
MRWRRVFGRTRIDRERADELQSHLDLATEYYVARGLTPAEAARRARLRLGNPRAKREEFDEMNRVPLLDALWRDLRFALRVLRRAPVFTTTAILTLAVVIGANAAVFSLADHILLRPLPYPHPDQLAVVEANIAGAGAQYESDSVNGRMWEAVRDHLSSADAGLSSGDLGSGVNIVVGGTAAFVQQLRVSAGFFHALGVVPRIGREFTRDEDRPGGPAVVILSDRLWREDFHGAPDILGQSVLLRGDRYQVVGVMAPGFRSPRVDADVWTPLRPTTTGEGAGTNYGLFIRRHDDATWPQVNADLEALTTPALFDGVGRIPDGGRAWLSARPMQDDLVQDERAPLVALVGAVVLVLLIACVNLAALLVARGTSRTREIATRLALGASRRAVVGQLFVESLVLAAAGGALGVFIGRGLLEGLQSMGGALFADWTYAAFDGRVLAATVALTFVTSLLFGLVPAVLVSRIAVGTAMAVDGARVIGGGARHAVRRGLVVAEVALSVVLLVCAGLLIRTVVNLRGIDAGYDPHGVTAASVSLEDARYADPATVIRLFDSTLERIHRTPGVESAAVSLGLPYTRLLNIGGVRFDDESNGHIVNCSYVTPEFVRTLRIPVLRGRDLRDSDRLDAPSVVLVNETFARLYSTDRDVIGRRIQLGRTTREIVGVIGDVQQAGSGFFIEGMTRGPIRAMPTVYLPAAQAATLFSAHLWFRPYWVVRASSTSVATRALLDAIGSVDSLLPVADVQSMTDVEAAAIRQQRLLMTVVGVLATAALLLAAIGLFGLLSHLVTERTREIGVRLAIGATTGQAVRSVVWSGLGLATVGLGVGGLLSVPAVRLVQSFLWGVAAHDPRTYVAAGAFLLLTAAVASVVPALRILRFDPAKILRA